MTTITIPNKLIEEKELIVIPLKEYKRFLQLEKIIKKEKNVTDLVINDGLKDLREGRTSPTFNSTKTAIQYLHRQVKKYNKSIIK